MKTVISTFRKSKLHRNTPLILTCAEKQIFFYIDWDRSSTNCINVIVKADLEVDVLIPSTFNKLKEKIILLENELERLKRA